MTTIPGTSGNDRGGYVPGGASTRERAYDAVMAAWSHGQISKARLRASAERGIAFKQTYHVLH
jgi:hypothetical protein